MIKTNQVALYIDPPSHHFLGDRLFEVDDGRLTGDCLNAPYAHLRDYLTARGIPVHTADHLPEHENGGRNVYVSLGILANYRKIARRRDTVLSAFFAMECPIVEPSMYKALGPAQNYFKRIFSWGDSRSLERFVGKPIRLEPFCWPQSFEDVHEEIWNRTGRKFLVMINANKLPRLYWQELYTERMRAVEFFGRTSEIDLYGKGWDEPSHRVGKTWEPYTLRRVRHKFLCHWQRFRPDPLLEAARKAYCGTAKSKAETLSKYNFALCFENAIINGWITEKIFDCFFAGTVPVYWGAPDIESHIPSDCFIDMRKFAGYEELRAYLKSLGGEDIQAYKENARRYLRSPDFRRFSKQAFAELISRIISEDTGSTIMSLLDEPEVAALQRASNTAPAGSDLRIV
jgi:alpha(1,3/1,4) fucosyltransferase